MKTEIFWSMLRCLPFICLRKYKFATKFIHTNIFQYYKYHEAMCWRHYTNPYQNVLVNDHYPSVSLSTINTLIDNKEQIKR